MFVALSHSMQEGENIEVEPFLLNSKSRMEPSEFVVFFMQDNVRYRYGFAVNNERVLRNGSLPILKADRRNGLREALMIGTLELIFPALPSRSNFGRRQPGKMPYFLSTAVQLNNEQLKPVFNWFKQKLMVIKSSGIINWQDSAIKCVSDEGKKRILNL